ncbi:Noc3p protein [Uncinocarpus reesii 1704]|uniref:Noc3p protein n=1 Tax=Uncinocarpus reesii (strain UAMH 1704) TaxID=336963 RepID=C4JUU2_UNCRE|nr:Noc3p protein [Uncinocarpus reesii 1704]EEP80053.1 Noc3p protein [Uncinocarpus reesii 1704]
MAPVHTAKRRRLSPTGEAAPSSAMKTFYASASQWDLEQDYERRPRKGSKKDRERTRLPIKTAEGNIEHIEEPQHSEPESLSPFDSDEQSDDDAPAPKPVQEPVSQVPPKLQIIQAKEELARIAMIINEDPEEHMESFKRLAEMVKSSSLPAVKKLALATQAAVYRDVIPGYKIRPLGEAELTVKVSKEVRKVRDYEQALLSGYRNYIQELVRLARSKHDEGLKSVAINCACGLLTAVPHFNFRQELLKILVSLVTRRHLDADGIKARETIKEIFSNDEDGIISMETVSLLAKTMKSKNFNVHHSTLDTFLHLRLLSEFSLKGSHDRIDKEETEGNTYKGKKIKEKREFRTKKERKLLRERKAAAKDLKEADALVKNEQRDKMQAETLNQRDR